MSAQNDYAALSANVEFTTSKGVNILGLSSINQENSVHYLIYKIVNVVQGKYYIGQHCTKNPLDDYMGSGSYIERAISCHGLSQFVKILIADHSNFDDMNLHEKQLVQLSNCYPNDLMSYNLVEGGNGKMTNQLKKKISDTLKGKMAGKNNPMYGYQWSLEQRKHQSKIMKGRQVSEEFREQCRKRCKGNGNPMYGKYHSIESKAKMSKIRIENGIAVGKKNPMYGLRCMTAEQIIAWKQKISIGNKGRKISEEERRRRSEKAKELHIKRMHNPQTGKIVNVPQAKVKEFLNIGYVLGSGIKSMLGKTGACAGKRIMTSPDGSKHYIKIEDIQHYIALGWKQSKRSKPI